MGCGGTGASSVEIAIAKGCWKMVQVAAVESVRQMDVVRRDRRVEGMLEVSELRLSSEPGGIRSNQTLAVARGL